MIRQLVTFWASILRPKQHPRPLLNETTEDVDLTALAEAVGVMTPADREREEAAEFIVWLNERGVDTRDIESRF